VRGVPATTFKFLNFQVSKISRYFDIS